MLRIWGPIIGVRVVDGSGALVLALLGEVGELVGEFRMDAAGHGGDRLRGCAGL